MIKNKFVHNIQENLHDYGFGVKLREIMITSSNLNLSDKIFLIGLEYPHQNLNKRNLYDSETNQLVGFIQYDKNRELELDNRNRIKKSIKYHIFFDEQYS